MTIKITLTSAGSDSGPFDIYENSTGSFVLVQANVSKPLLVQGYNVTVPNGTTIVRVQSTGECTNYQDISVQITTTTAEPTTTAAPTTTEAPIVCISYNVEIPEVDTVTISYYDCNNNFVPLEPLTGPDAIQFCAKEGTILTVPSGTSIVTALGSCGAISTVSVLVGYSDLNDTTACDNYTIDQIVRYIPAGEDWQTATAIYLNATGTPAQAGYYSDGAKWHYWTESAITSTGFC